MILIHGFDDQQAEVIAFLSDPNTHGGGDVVQCRTHGSIVFLAGDRAYKLKRAVKYPYMDYSTATRRKAMCEAELAVNKRLAPELYLGVKPVVRRNGRLAIGDAQDGSALDWLVVMRRFDQTALLGHLCEHGGLTRDLMRRLGERIASFHRSAERRTDFGGAEGIAAVVDENRDLLGKLAGRPLDPRKIARLDILARAELARLATLLDARRANGFVRRCHGDLHLFNICLFEGEPVPFDAIEFLDQFIFIDVLFDLAFLLMDLDRRGFRHEANIVLNRYVEETGDYDGLAALPLFMSCRAALRSHILMAISELGGKERESEFAREADRLLDSALAYLAPRTVSLTAIGGISGTGKSSVAAELAPLTGGAPGAIVLRSDVIRKQLCGADVLVRLPEESYDRKTTEKVYAAIGERAERVLKSGFSVIADSVFGTNAQRSRIAQVPRDLDAVFCGIWLHAPTGVLEQRLRERRGDASDATVDVMRSQLRSVHAPEDWRLTDANRAPAETAREIAARAEGV